MERLRPIWDELQQAKRAAEAAHAKLGAEFGQMEALFQQKIEGLKDFVKVVAAERAALLSSHAARAKSAAVTPQEDDAFWSRLAQNPVAVSPPDAASLTSFLASHSHTHIPLPPGRM